MGIASEYNLNMAILRLDNANILSTSSRLIINWNKIQNVIVIHIISFNNTNMGINNLLITSRIYYLEISDIAYYSSRMEHNSNLTFWKEENISIYFNIMLFKLSFQHILRFLTSDYLSINVYSIRIIIYKDIKYNK